MDFGFYAAGFCVLRSMYALPRLPLDHPGSYSVDLHVRIHPSSTSIIGPGPGLGDSELDLDMDSLSPLVADRIGPTSTSISQPTNWSYNQMIERPLVYYGLGMVIGWTWDDRQSCRRRRRTPSLIAADRGCDVHSGDDGRIMLCLCRWIALVHPV